MSAFQEIRQDSLGWVMAAAAIPLAVLGLWELSGWDLPVMRLFGDASGFAWRDHGLTRGLAHDGGRWLAGLVLVLLMWAAWRPGDRGPTRQERVWTLVVILIGLLAVPAYKRWSSTSCPWSLQEFGGTATYVSHWLRGVADGGPGRCFPSGHAVAAFAFFPQVLLWRRYNHRRATLWLVGILVLGFCFALAQTARGAHYPSHSMWSAVLCWLLALVLSRPMACLRRRGLF